MCVHTHRKDVQAYYNCIFIAGAHSRDSVRGCVHKEWKNAHEKYPHTARSKNTKISGPDGSTQTECKALNSINTYTYTCAYTRLAEAHVALYKRIPPPVNVCCAHLSAGHTHIYYSTAYTGPFGPRSARILLSVAVTCVFYL